MFSLKLDIIINGDDMEFMYLLAFIVLGFIVFNRSSNKKLSKRQKEYRKYLGSEHWIETKALAKRRAGYKCQLCGNTRYLQVHHNNYSRLGHEQDNDLIVLCRNCHAKYHNKYKK